MRAPLAYRVRNSEARSVAESIELSRRGHGDYARERRFFGRLADSGSIPDASTNQECPPRWASCFCGSSVIRPSLLLRLSCRLNSRRLHKCCPSEPTTVEARTNMVATQAKKKILIVAAERCRQDDVRARVLARRAQCPTFVNADLIATGLSPFNPGRGDARGAAAIQRVVERVAQGGHFVPKSIVGRRFQAGKQNLDAIYKPLVDAWALYDKSNGEPILLSWGEK